MDRMMDEKRNLANGFNVTQAYPIGANASFNRYLFTCPAAFPDKVGALVIEDVVLVSDTAVTAHDTNYWSMQLVNLTKTEDLMAAVITTKVTGGTAITADTAYRLTPDQNNSLGSSEVVELQLTKAASATDLTAAVLSVVVVWRWKMGV